MKRANKQNSIERVNHTDEATISVSSAADSALETLTDHVGLNVSGGTVDTLETLIGSGL